MTRTTFGWTTALLAAAGALTIATAATVPDPFEVTLLTTDLMEPMGLDAALHQAGAGPMGGFIYIAEGGLDRVVRVDRRTGEAEYFADTMGTFPVGLGCYGGPFGQYLYVGNAMGGGITRVDAEGETEPFALAGMDIAGLDFGRGQFGTDLYAAEWSAGTIWQIDVQGNAAPFLSLPNAEIVYLEVSQGGPFGNYLYFTDSLTGTIYRADPTGQVEIFAPTGYPCLAGFAFSQGGAFGHYLYVGDLCMGEILQVAPDGTVISWAQEFEGVADIIFEPGGRGGFSMYIVDGVSSAYRISRE